MERLMWLIQLQYLIGAAFLMFIILFLAIKLNNLSKNPFHEPNTQSPADPVHAGRTGSIRPVNTGLLQTYPHSGRIIGIIESKNTGIIDVGLDPEGWLVPDQFAPVDKMMEEVYPGIDYFTHRTEGIIRVSCVTDTEKDYGYSNDVLLKDRSTGIVKRMDQVTFHKNFTVIKINYSL